MIISEASMAQTVWQRVFELINTNKPTGWSVSSSFPSRGNFPCIVIRNPNITPMLADISGTTRVYDAEVEIVLYCIWSQNENGSKGMELLDVGRDNVRNTILTNQTFLKNAGLFLQSDVFDDSDVGEVDLGGNRLNSAGMILRLQVR